MRVSDSVKILKAMADSSRIRILQALLQEEQYVEVLSERLDLAPSTVSFHMKKLEEASLVVGSRQQYYTMYRVRPEVFDMRLRELIGARDPGIPRQVARIEAYRRKILATYFKEGRVEKLPSQHKKRWIVLEEIARHFESERRYTEKEVNEIIARFHDDFCTVRRELIAEKVMLRAEGIYIMQPDWNRSEESGQEAGAHTMKQSFLDSVRDRVNESERRKRLKWAYKESHKASPGVVRIAVGEAMYITSAMDTASMCNRVLTQLQAGQYRDRRVQKAFNELGEGAFTYEVLENLKTDDDDASEIRDQLKKRVAYWLEQSFE